MTLAALDEINSVLVAAVVAAGGRIDGVFMCPHTIEDDCDCRKPKGGLADQALVGVPGIDLAAAVMIGDSATDVEFADRLGLPVVQVLEEGATQDLRAVAVVPDLRIAAELLTQEVRTERAPVRRDHTPRGRS
jgi:D-glycero-D-manno-heptose 1,7-bisphosphate phosphatase